MTHKMRKIVHREIIHNHKFIEHKPIKILNVLNDLTKYSREIKI